MHTLRLEAASDIGDMLRAIFPAQSNIKIRDKRYYYPSQNGLVLDQPPVVANKADLRRVLQRVGQMDWLEYFR